MSQAPFRHGRALAATFWTASRMRPDFPRRPGAWLPSRNDLGLWSIVGRPPIVAGTGATIF